MGKQLTVIQPETKYFRCDPRELCEGAQCCRSLETSPALSLGDYVRLSEYTGLPISKIWHDNGDVYAYPVLGNQFQATLGLLHDPCPYLKNDLKCGVYEMRPSGCAGFPLI